jgi:hypothetical protein
MHIVLSIDFELRWGVQERLGYDMLAYRRNLEGVRDAVPAMLEVLHARRAKATWAIVGAIACEGWDELETRAPVAPCYTTLPNLDRSVLRQLDPKGRLHFAPDLVESVRATPGQELGSHTFGHVFLREAGFTEQDAEADAAAMAALFRARWGTAPSSFVFPRNQVAHLPALRRAGISAFRINPSAWYWDATASHEQTRSARALRLLDAFAPLGRRTYRVGLEGSQRSSHFVRFNLPRLAWRAHLRRIARDARAAGDGETVHLWWHPHNLGAEPRQGSQRLAELLDSLRDVAPGSRFATMAELAPAREQAF